MNRFIIFLRLRFSAHSLLINAIPHNGKKKQRGRRKPWRHPQPALG
jgi:hypothetical protein